MRKLLFFLETKNHSCLMLANSFANINKLLAEDDAIVK